MEIALLLLVLALLWAVWDRTNQAAKQHQELMERLWHIKTQLETPAQLHQRVYGREL